MRGRHSIEIKTLLEQSSHRMKKEDHDSDSSLTAYSYNHSHTLKSSDSTSTLARTSSEISLIQDRFLTLEMDYHKLLDQTEQKSLLFKKQKNQLEKYRGLHLKNQKEIEQLKSLINIAKKSDHSSSSMSKSTVGGSSVGRRQNSSGPLLKERVAPITHMRSPLMSSQINGSKEGSGLKKMGGREREKGQFGRYKFSPTLLQ